MDQLPIDQPVLLGDRQQGVYEHRVWAVLCLCDVLPNDRPPSPGPPLR